MPLYRWDVIEAEHFRWLRERVRRNADLFDGYRIDHLVGFYRTYAWPTDGSKPFFTPAEEHAQTHLGERLMAVFREAGSTIVAEDLGIVPDFVRESLARLKLPGYKVFRWEREWHQEGQPFKDPIGYPACAVATSGTHDTEPLAEWLQSAPAEERRQLLAVPSVARYLKDSTPPFDALLRSLLDAGSAIAIIPLQDVFGWTDRINTPALVSDENWTWRVRWQVDRLDDIEEAQERTKALAEWTRASGR